MVAVLVVKERSLETRSVEERGTRAGDDCDGGGENGWPHKLQRSRGLLSLEGPVTSPRAAQLGVACGAARMAAIAADPRGRRSGLPAGDRRARKPREHFALASQKAAKRQKPVAGCDGSRRRRSVPIVRAADIAVELEPQL